MGNFINDIEIKNFKSIRHQHVSDCRRINLFIGYPNVGKSNLLEALSLFSIDKEAFDFSSVIRIEDLTTLFYDGETSTDTEVIINRRHQYSAAHQYSADLEGYYIAFKYLYDELDYRVNKVDKSDLFEVRSFELQDKNSKLDIINFRSGNLIAEKEEKLAAIKKYEFSKKLVSNNSGDKVLKHPFGENIFEILNTNSQIKEFASELLTEYHLELIYDSRIRGFTILKRMSRGIFTVPYNLLADTLQRLIFYKAAIYSNDNCILLFEEPEAHMFPPYISKLSSDIWYKKDNQYFITTHSPFVVNDFLENSKEELAIFVLEYKNGETIVKRLSEEQVHEAYQYGLDLFLNVQSLVE